MKHLNVGDTLKIEKMIYSLTFTVVLGLISFTSFDEEEVK